MTCLYYTKAYQIFHLILVIIVQRIFIFRFNNLCIDSSQVWFYKNANFELLNNKILQFDWTCLIQGSVNDASTLFNNIFIEFVKVCIPCESILVEKMTNHGMTLRFDEINGKEIGTKKAVK